MRRGFTTLELLMVIALMVLTVSLTVPLAHRALTSVQTGDAAASLLGALQSAYARAESGYHASPHGVFFTPTSTIVFEGASFIERTRAFDVTLPLEKGTEIRSAVGNEVVFEQMTGIPSTSGVVDVHAAANPGQVRRITITDLGVSFIESL